MPPAVLGAVAIVATVGSAVAGSLSASADRNAAKSAQERALEIIKQTGAPPSEAREILLQQYKQAGIYTPQLEQTVNQNFSQIANIKEDPSVRDAQSNALQQMSQQGQKGFNAEDIASLNQARAQAQQDAQAKSQQIQQSLQSRGQYGSGTELAGQLQAGQSGAQRESTNSINQAGVASQRALQALTASGQLSGQIRSQDFDVAKTKANAADELARFNTQNQINSQMRNIGRNNEAQQANLANAQQVANANTQQANAEKYRQAAAERQYWQDKLNYAKDQSDAELGYAKGRQTSGDATAQGWTNVGSGIASGAGAIANAQGKQKTSNLATEGPGKTVDAAQNTDGDGTGFWK